MDILELIESLAQGKELSSETIVGEAIAFIKYEPYNILFPNDKNLENINLSELIDHLCRIQDFNHLPASGRATVMALWTTVRKRICSVSVHGSFTHSTIDLNLVEIIYSHLIKSHVPSTWYRSITSWFTLIYRTEEDVLGVASESIQDYLNTISAGDTIKLLELSTTISPYITLPNLNSWTLLHYACSLTDMTYRTKEIIDILLQTGVNVNEQDSNGQTPIHIAAQNSNHTALLTLSHCSQSSKTIKDKNGRLALDIFADTITKKKCRPTLSSEKIFTMIKLLLPENDPSYLWSLWKCDSESHPLRNRECCIYRIVTCCNDQVGIDVLLLSSNVEWKSPHFKYVIIEMMICSIMKRKMKILPQLLHLYIHCEKEYFTIFSARNGGLSNDDIQIRRVFDWFELLNECLIISCQHRFKEATQLIFEIFWPVILRFFDSSNTCLLVKSLPDFPSCFKTLFSRYHWFSLHNEVDAINHELKSFPHWVTPILLFGIVDVDEKHVDAHQGRQVRTFLEKKERSDGQSLFNTWKQNKELAEYPLLVWTCVIHGNPSYLRISGDDRNKDSADQSNGEIIHNTNKSIKPQNSSMLDILLRKLFSLVDGDILRKGSPRIRYLFSQSLYYCLLCGNLKSLEALQSFLGFSSFMDFLTKKDIFGVNDTMKPLIKDFYALCTREFFHWQFSNEKNKFGNQSWQTVGCPRYVKKSLKFTEKVLKHCLLTTFDRSTLVSPYKFDKVDVLIVQRFTIIQEWLMKNMQLKKNSDPNDLHQIINRMTQTSPVCKELSDYHARRLKMWNEVKGSIYDETRTFQIGLRKIIKKFPPDEKWMKLSYLFQLYLEVISSSSSTNSSQVITAKDEHPKILTIEKSDWDKFIKTTSQVFRSYESQQSFMTKIMSLATNTEQYINCAGRNLSSHELNWKNIFDNPKSMQKWLLFSKAYNKDIVLKVILHRKNVVTGRRSIFDCDYENEKKSDRSIAFVFKTISLLLDTVYDDGMTYFRLCHQAHAEFITAQCDDGNDRVHETKISSHVFLQALQLQHTFDCLHFYVQSRPQWFMDIIRAEDFQLPISSTTADSLLVYALSRQDSATEERLTITKLQYNKIMETCERLQLLDRNEGMIHSKIKCGARQSSQSNSFVLLREKYSQLQFQHNISYQEILHLMVDISFSIGCGDQLSFVFPLCLLKCYDIAEKILKHFMDNKLSVIDRNTTGKDFSDDTFPNMAIDLHHFYRYIVRQPGETIPQMIKRLVTQSILNTETANDVNINGIYQITPIHLALIDGNYQFISTFVKCFPKFPLHFAQLHALIDEEKLYDGGISLLSEFLLYKSDDFGPLRPFVDNDKTYWEEMNMGMNRNLKINPYQFKNRALIEDIFKMLHTRAADFISGVPLKCRRNYAYFDSRLLFDYAVELVDPPQNSSCNPRQASPPKLCLMDGTMISVELVKSNRYLLSRALPAPHTTPGVSGNGETLLHLFASGQLFDAMEALVVKNPEWIHLLDYPDKTGHSPLYYCLLHRGYSVINRLLRIRTVSAKSNANSSSEIVDKMIEQGYQPKYSLIKWIEAHNQHQMKLLKSQQVTLRKFNPATDAFKFSPSFPTFASATKGVPYDSLLQKLTLMLEYTKSVWESITNQRNFLKFVHFSVSSSLWSKMDSIVRARQVLTILGIPYSYLTNSTTTAHDRENPSQGKPIKELLFEFEPHALMQKLTPSIHNQLRFLLSGWFRLRIGETGNVHPNSTEATLNDCLFVFHSQRENCVQYGMKTATKACLPKISGLISKGDNKRKIVEPAQVDIVKELVRMEMVSNRENSVGNSTYGWNITDAAVKYADELSDALQSAFLLLEFAKCLCACRILILATCDQQEHKYSSSRVDSTSKSFKKKILIENEDSTRVQSSLRFKQHPIHQVNKQLQHYDRQIKWLSKLSDEPLCKGLSHRIQLLDLLLPTEFRNFLKFKTEYSKRVSLLKDFLCNALIALLMDFGKPQYCELVTRLMLSGKVNGLDGGDDSKSIQSTTASILEGNKPLKKTNAVMSDDVESINFILEYMRSFRIADFWSPPESNKCKKFMHVFESMLVRPTASLDSQLLVDLVKTLKMGTMLEIIDEEERSIISLFSVMNPDLKLTPFRREQLINEVMEQLRITLKVTSELYWFLTSIYGLFNHSSIKSPIESLSNDASLSIYNCSTYSEDISINKIQSNKFDPRLILARPSPIQSSQGDSLHNSSNRAYKECVEKVFHLVTRENHVETNLRIIQQAALFGNIDLLQQCHPTLRIVSATPSLQKHIQQLIFYTILLCPIPCDKVVENSHNIAYPSTSWRKRDVQILFENYCNCIRLLLTHRFPLLSPPGWQFGEDVSLSVLDLALMKNMPWDIISKILSLSPTAFSVNGGDEAKELEAKNTADPVQIPHVVVKFSVMTIFFLHKYSANGIDAAHTAEIEKNKQELWKKVISNITSKMCMNHRSTFDKVFSFTNMMKGTMATSVDWTLSEEMDSINATMLTYIGIIVSKFIQSLGCHQNDVNERFGSCILTYVDLTFKRALIGSATRCVPLCKSKLLSLGQVECICPFIRDIHHFLALSPQEEKTPRDNSKEWSWSWIELAVLTKDINFLETCCSILSNSQVRNDELLLSTIKEILLQAIHHNDLLVIKFLFEFISQQFETNNEWSDIINNPFTIQSNFCNNVEKCREVVEFQLIDKVSEYHDRPQIMSFLLNHQLQVDVGSILRMLCGGLTTEDILCEVVRIFVQRCREEGNEMAIEDLKNITICYDNVLQKDLLINQDTPFHIICRRGFSKLASLFMTQVFELKPIKLFPSLMGPFGQWKLRKRNRVSDQHEYNPIEDSVNSNNESPLMISIAQGYCALTRILGSYCSVEVHQAARVITFVFRLFALNRKTIKKKYLEFRKNLLRVQYEPEEEEEGEERSEQRSDDGYRDYTDDEYY